MGKLRRQERRGTAIHAYTGANGGGKTLAMIYDTIPSLQQGRPVLSTVRLVDPETGDDHPLYTPLTEWHQLLDFEWGDVLLDEVQGVAASTQHHALPPAVANLIHQMRRRDCAVRWTTPSYARGDIRLREVTQAVTYCTGYLAEPAYRETTDGEKVRRLWGHNRLFRWRTYDALEFDEFDNGKREQLKAINRQWYYRPWDDAQEWYRTLDAVDHIDQATEGGTCLLCGGRRRRPSCKCGGDEGDQLAALREAAASA